MYQLFKNLLLSFISIFLFILLAEILTRIFWLPDNKNETIRKGIILEGANRTVVYEGIEYKVNSYGIRNKVVPIDKGNDDLRIMALGDSFIWGDGLQDDELITYKLESLFTKKLNQQVSVINAGISGFNTKDEYNQLTRLYSAYKPDAVIQFFFTNDLLAVNDSNKIVDWRIHAHMWLRKHSKFYSFFYYIIKSTIASEKSFPSFILPKDYYGLDDTKPGWRDFKKYTTLIKNFCEENNVKYFFVLIPTLTNLNDNYPYSEVNQKVEEFTNSMKITFFSLFNVFYGYNAEDLWVSGANTHWNAKATQIAGEHLSAFLYTNNIFR